MNDSESVSTESFPPSDADSARAHFVAIASHEMRTPLTSIAGFSATLVERWDSMADTERREFVSIIHQQAQRMMRLIDDVLVVSRINAGALNIELQPVNICDAIAKAVDQFPDSEIGVECAASIWALADPESLQQSLVNYISNAIRYGAAPITVAGSGDDRWTRVQVIDNGSGIPDDFLPHLFEEFAPSTYGGDIPHHGSGLGLSIVRRFMQAQGGDAWYEPNAPHGSRFGITLPAATS